MDFKIGYTIAILLGFLWMNLGNYIICKSESLLVLIEMKDYSVQDIMYCTDGLWLIS